MVCMYTYGDSVEAIGFQLGDIGCTDAVGLDAIDVHNECLLMVSRVNHREWV